MTWIQRSVFVGEIPESKVIELEKMLKMKMDLEHDSAIIFKISSRRLVKIRKVGSSKYKEFERSNIIIGGDRGWEEGC